MQVVVAGHKWAVIFQEWIMDVLNPSHSYTREHLTPDYSTAGYSEYYYHKLPDTFEMSCDSEMPMMIIIGQRWSPAEYQFKVQQYQKPDLLVFWNEITKTLTVRELETQCKQVC